MADSEVRNPATGFTVAPVTQPPVDFQQMVSEVPTGLKVGVKPGTVQMTTRSFRKLIRRNPTILMHYQNLPLIEPLLFTSAIYRTVRDMALNHQKQAQSAFFEDYSGLLILSPEERADPSILTTHYLRLHYRTFAKRLAHYYMHYQYAITMVWGTIANLLCLTRLNGNEMWKTIADHVRWSRLNNAMNTINMFPTPANVVKYVLENTRYGYGRTAYGADLLSIPMWITDVFGSRGQHAPSIASLVIRQGGNKPVAAAWDENGVHNEEASVLHTMMALTLKEYGAFNEDSTVQYYPDTPVIENGHFVAYPDTAMGGFVGLQTNMGGKAQNIGQFGGKKFEFMSGDALTDTLWANYHFWVDYLLKNFSGMTDPNADVRVFATTQLKLYDPAVTSPEDALNIVRGLSNWDMVDMAKRMQYKGTNKVNTATVVKWMPLIGGSMKFADVLDGQSVTETAAFSLNMERYDVDSDSVPLMLRNAKQFPGLNPTLFALDPIRTDDDGMNALIDQETFYQGVLNGTMPCRVDATYLAADGEKYYGAKVSVFGADATLFDFTCCNFVDPGDSQITGNGVSSEYMHDFISQNDGVVYREDPTTVHALAQPIFDSTDIYQCGFVLVASNDAVHQDEWVDFLLQNDPDTTDFDYADGKTPGIYQASLTKPDPQHPLGLVRSLRNVMRYHKRAFVFIGMACFDHPWMRYTAKNLVDPTYEMQLDSSGLRDPIVGAEWGNTDNASLALTMIVDASEPCMAAKSLPTDVSTSPFLASKVTPMSTSGVANDGTLAWVEKAFNPAWGPVQLGSLLDPFGFNPPMDVFVGEKAPLGMSPATDFDTEGYNPSLAAFTTEMYLDTAHFGYRDMGFARVRDLLADPQFTAVKQMLFFLESFVHTVVWVGDNGVATIMGKPKPAVIANKAFYPYRLLAGLMAMFPGKEDTVYFWDQLGGKTLAQLDTPSIATTTQMPQNNLLAAPRVPRQTNKPKVNYEQFKGNAVQPHSAGNAAAAAVGLRGDRESSCEKVTDRSHRKSASHKRVRSKSPNSVKDSLDRPMNDGNPMKDHSIPPSASQSGVASGENPSSTPNGVKDLKESADFVKKLRSHSGAPVSSQVIQ